MTSRLFKNSMSGQPSQLNLLLNGFHSTALRLEARKSYLVDDERAAMTAYLAGELVPPHRDSWWPQHVASCLSAGKQVSRVRVVTEPLPPYVRYQINWGYAPGVLAGEEVEIHRRHGSDDLTDFWLFDDEVLALMYYDEEGRFLRIETTEDASAVARAMDLVASLRKDVLSLRAYLAKLRSGEIVA